MLLFFYYLYNVIRQQLKNKKMKNTKTTKLTTAEKAFNIFYLVSPVLFYLILKNI